MAVAAVDNSRNARLVNVAISPVSPWIIAT
jgi:hypothetical protein